MQQVVIAEATARHHIARGGNGEEVVLAVTAKHAAKSYLSTLAVLQLDSILIGAKKVSSQKPQRGNKNQKPFERILIMEYELVGIGTVKMTVGVRRKTREKVQ